ncbi:hypothetical protein [Rhodococcus sp. IEGM1428]|uniref:hypothetical protein n=1 Tax=Rhodococcus sp. IEGM1428 TaxID=3392191 RepID=UPI003D123C17
MNSTSRHGCPSDGSRSGRAISRARQRWATSSIAGSCATITGVGHYAELGDFDNTWTVTFEGGLCSRFDMINTERAR